MSQFKKPVAPVFALILMCCAAHTCAQETAHESASILDFGADIDHSKEWLKRLGFEIQTRIDRFHYGLRETSQIEQEGCTAVLAVDSKGRTQSLMCKESNDFSKLREAYRRKFGIPYIHNGSGCTEQLLWDCGQSAVVLVNSNNPNPACFMGLKSSDDIRDLFSAIVHDHKIGRLKSYANGFASGFLAQEKTKVIIASETRKIPKALSKVDLDAALKSIADTAEKARLIDYKADLVRNNTQFQEIADRNKSSAIFGRGFNDGRKYADECNYGGLQEQFESIKQGLTAYSADEAKKLGLSETDAVEVANFYAKGFEKKP